MREISNSNPPLKIIVRHPFPAGRTNIGDTFTKTFEIKGIKATSDRERSTYDFTCRLVNQRGKVCMECDRATMFPFFAPSSQSSETTGSPGAPQTGKTADRLRDHVVKQSEKLGELCARFLWRVRVCFLSLPPFGFSDVCKALFITVDG